MKKIVLLFPLISLLSACQPPMTREQQLFIYRSRCIEYGFQPGTPEFASCMQKQEIKEAELALQNRKVSALEDSNRIEQNKVWAKENELRKREKEYKKMKKK
jgi:hypothetical protein